VTESDIKHKFEAFNNLSILVVGDLMIDAYLLGNVDRISPEAPVPVISIDKRDNRLGGAANVALNLIALGAKTFIAGVVGDDKNANIFLELLHDHNINGALVIKDESRPTTIKTRIISGHQQMLRIDEEQTNTISSSIETKLISRIEQVVKSGIDAIIFEDYNKGLLSNSVIEKIIQIAKKHNIPTCVDPKKDNFFAYQGVTLFKPNLKELKMGLKQEMAYINLETLTKAGQQLKSQLQHDITFVTLSEHGVYISDENKDFHLPAHVRNISDVSGAGDTVISVATCCLVTGFDLEAVAAISNLSGGLVCEYSGVVAIDKAHLLSEAIKLISK